MSQGSGLLVLLGIFLGMAALINRFAGKPVANGAFYFLVVAAAFFPVSVLFALSGNDGAYALGGVFGSFLIPVAAALYLNRRFKRQRTASASASGE